MIHINTYKTVIYKHSISFPSKDLAKDFFHMISKEDIIRPILKGHTINFSSYDANLANSLVKDFETNYLIQNNDPPPSKESIPEETE